MKKNGTAKKFGRRYPWTDWFSRPKFSLERGRDYSCMPHGMAQMVRNNAAARKVHVEVHIQEDGRIDVINKEGTDAKDRTTTTSI